MELHVAARSVDPLSPWSKELWLAADRRGRVALFECEAGRVAPEGAGVLVGVRADEALRQECQLAWLLTRPLVQISSSDDLEDYEDGAPFVAVLEELDLPRDLAARGLARFLAEGKTVRVVLGPKATAKDADAVRASDSYQGSMALDAELWLESLTRRGMSTFAESPDAPGAYRRSSDGADLTLDMFSAAVRPRIVQLDADFERDPLVRAPGPVPAAAPLREAPPRLSLEVVRASSEGVLGSAEVVGASSQEVLGPAPMRADPLEAAMGLAVDDDDEVIWAPKRTLGDWTMLVAFVCVAGVLLGLLITSC